MPASDLHSEFFRHNVKTLAHYLWVVRGGRNDQDEQNWLDAETQLKRLLFKDTIERIVSGASNEQIDVLLKALDVDRRA